MAKKETLSEFVKNLGTFDQQIQVSALREWDRATLEAKGKAAEMTPLASGALQNSIDRIKAVITNKGLESFIFSLLPYAKPLHRGTMIRDGKTVDIKLKPPGVLSYYLKGTKIMKERKGEFGFISKGVDDTDFVRGISRIISKVWKKI